MEAATSCRATSLMPPVAPIAVSHPGSSANESLLLAGDCAWMGRGSPGQWGSWAFGGQFF